MNKRAQEVNITTIIIVILAILVLVIVAAAFTGGMKSSIDKIKEFLGVSVAASTEEAKSFCDVWCSQEQYKTWCGHGFTKIEGSSTEDPKYCKDVGSVCPGAATAKAC